MLDTHLWIRAVLSLLRHTLAKCLDARVGYGYIRFRTRIRNQHQLLEHQRQQH